MNQWIRTADKLPEHTNEVLAFAPGKGNVMAYYLHGDDYPNARWMCDRLRTIEPTHWMPLPEPPQTGEKSK